MSGLDAILFSIFHITLVICHCRNRAGLEMTNDKSKMIYIFFTFG
jgi:hypothetical protein